MNEPAFIAPIPNAAQISAEKASQTRLKRYGLIALVLLVVGGLYFALSKSLAATVKGVIVVTVLGGIAFVVYIIGFALNPNLKKTGL